MVQASATSHQVGSTTISTRGDVQISLLPSGITDVVISFKKHTALSPSLHTVKGPFHLESDGVIIPAEWPEGSGVLEVVDLNELISRFPQHVPTTGVIGDCEVCRDEEGKYSCIRKACTRTCNLYDGGPIYCRCA
jgi:hypothetical protein